MKDTWPIMADLITVASRWATLDDWGVPAIYIDTLKDLAISLDMGDDKDALREHAKHSPKDCKALDCEHTIPSYWKMKEFR